MRLDVLDKRVPLELLLSIYVPTLSVLVVPCLSQQRRVMHHFFGDTPDIYASAA